MSRLEKAMDFLPPALAAKPNFAHLVRLLDDIEKCSSHHNCPHRDLAFQPRFDLLETPDALELYGDLPSVHKDDVSVEFTDPRTLVIKGSATHSYGVVVPPVAPAAATTNQEVPTEEIVAQPVPQPTCLVSERGAGSFQRTFKLPLDVSREGVVASFEGGVLHVCVPKPAKDTGDVRKIQIM